MSPRIREWGLNLLVLLAAVSVTLVAFEVGLRLFLPQKLYRFPAYMFQNDPELVFRLQPGFEGQIHSSEYHTRVRINSLGLRGPEVQPASPSTLRVLNVGDSFVAGLNVEEEETFSAVLGGWLTSALPGRQVDVINGGTPNYGTWHEVRALKRLLPEVSPDFVVLCVFTMNDVTNNLAPRTAEVRNGLLVRRVRWQGVLPMSVREWLQLNSMTYVFLWNAWNHLRPLVGGATIDPLGGFKALISSHPDPRTDEGYRISGELLQEFGAYLEEQDVPGMVVVIPGEIQVYYQRFAPLISAEQGTSLEKVTARPNERWMRLADEAGLPALDLLPLLRAQAQAAGPSLYMSLDSHFTREGNRLAGEAIGEALLPLLPHGDEGSR